MDATVVNLPRRGGGSEVVELELPSILRRMQLAAMYAESRADGDEVDHYAAQVLMFASLALAWKGGIPGMPARFPSDAAAGAEAAADALHALGIDLTSGAFYDAAGAAFAFVINSLAADEAAEAEAAEAAEELFREGPAEG